MTQSKATDHWPWIVLILLFLLACGIAWRQYSPTKPSGASLQRPVARAAIATSSSEKPGHQLSGENKSKIYHAASTARVRVRPGEAAVMGYYEIGPGKLGLTIVIPEARDDGTVRLQLRSIEASDSATLRTRAQELFPDIFELEKSGVIPQSRLNELMRFILNDGDVKTINFPSMVTASGMRCELASVVTSPGEKPLGITYAIQADALPGAEGFDLSLDYQHSGTREEE